MSQSERRASLFLRVGLALVFLYAAIAAFLNPSAWIGYIPVFVREIVSGTLLLNLFGIFEILLALWLLSGRRTYFAGILSALVLGVVTVSNITLLDIVFRDVAIMFMGISLAILHRKGDHLDT